MLRCRSKLHSLRPFRIIDGTLHRVFAGPIGLRARPVGASSERESQFHVIYEAEERFACRLRTARAHAQYLTLAAAPFPYLWHFWQLAQTENAHFYHRRRRIYWLSYCRVAADLRPSGLPSSTIFLPVCTEMFRIIRVSPSSRKTFSPMPHLNGRAISTPCGL